MHLTKLGLLSLGAAAVNAFQNTSPFFLASTSEILDESSPSQIQLYSSIPLLYRISKKLTSCPSDYYVIASQPGVHSSDFSGSKSAPRLGAKLLKEDKAVKSSLMINEVVEGLDAKHFQRVIEKNCRAENIAIDASKGSYPKSFGDSPRVISVDFPMLSVGSDREQQLQFNDGFLADIIERLPSSKYTLLYVTSPRENVDSSSTTHLPSGNDQYQDPLHMELKRDYSTHSRREDSKTQSLFQEYQYLTPGLFMGLLAAFFLLLILYVGISALSSLQVPYAAFERDTSASVQKKHQ